MNDLCLCYIPDTISHICIYSFILSINLLLDSGSFRPFDLVLSYVLNIGIVVSADVRQLPK